MHFRHLAVLLVCSILPAPFAAAKAAQQPATQTATSADHIQSQDEAVHQDAAEYARQFDVSLDEAVRRLRAQSASVPITDAVREAYKDRWAGIAIEHRPDFRIVILLTGDDPVPDQSVLAGDLTIPIVFRTGAARIRTEMLARISRYQADIRAMLPHPPGIGLDQRTGQMVVMIAAADARLNVDGVLRDRIATMTGVPVRIDPIDQPLTDMAPEGGGRVVGSVDGVRYACTTGFVVSDGTRNGVVTAAHCPDTLSYIDGARQAMPLEFVGQWGWGNQDVQVNVAPEPLAPVFFADTAKTTSRTVATWRYRESTRAGDFVCHRGERTGYSCAVVAMVDFAPAGDLCGGACLPTWVAVEGPTCKSGDSGAPVFDGETALGIVKGGTYRRDGSCRFYYYMSTDFLPQGWTLAHR